LPVLIEKHNGKRLRFTTSLQDGVNSAAIVFVAVGTPPCETGEADVSLLESVCREIARVMSGFKLVVVKSTVPVGTSTWMSRVLQQHGVNPKCFQIASNPEFLREGTAVTDFLYPDRIVLGCNGERAAELLRHVYRPLTDGSYAQRENAIPMPDHARVPTRLIITSPSSAELIKHSSNAFLAMKISFVNAIANICEANGADIEEVVEGVGSDQRIGDKFLRPGIGYGGSCFPKDLTALRALSQESGYDFRLLDEVIQINEDQRRAFIRKVRKALWTLKGKKLAVLGLAFKGGTDDIRESPAISIVRSLLREGCEIAAYDPAAISKASTELSHLQRISFAEDAYDAAAGADALLVLTDWEEFAALDFARLRRQMKQSIVIDGRNVYSREQMENAGFSYFSIGRAEILPNFYTASTGRDAA
jgi:UDPglucose 6-dehydrogenase